MPQPGGTNPLFQKYLFIIYMVFCFYVGAFLVVIPWLPWVWERNFFLIPGSGWEAALLSPYLRGAVSGLGLLNILAGLTDLGLWWRRRGGRDRQ